MKRQPKGIWGSDVAAYLSLSWDAEDSRPAAGRHRREEQERSCWPSLSVGTGLQWGSVCLQKAVCWSTGRPGASTAATVGASQSETDLGGTTAPDNARALPTPSSKQPVQEWLCLQSRRADRGKDGGWRCCLAVFSSIFFTRYTKFCLFKENHLNNSVIKLTGSKLRLF